MVKVTNPAGDEYKGKLGNQQYQGHYGRSIRKKQSEIHYKTTDLQKESRQNFKDAVNWVKSLTANEKISLKQIYREKYPSYETGQPNNWYNFAKNLYITKPRIEFTQPDPNLYKIIHPAIAEIVLYDHLKHPLFSVSDLSSIENHQLTDVYEFPVTGSPHAIGIKTLPGFEYIRFLTSSPYFYDFNCLERSCVSDE